MNEYGRYRGGSKTGADKRSTGTAREASSRRGQAGGRRDTSGTIIGYEQMKSTVRERARAADWQEGAKTVARRTQNEMADSRGQTVAGTSQAASAARASQGASAGDLRRTSSAKAVQASARKSMSVDARRRQQPTKRAASQSARRSYSQGIKTGSRYVGSEDRARARAKARKKKWRRQRRMLLSVLFLLVLVVAGAVLFNMVRSR